MYQFWQTGMKYQSIDICSLFCCLTLDFKNKSRNILNMNTVQPVHNLNPYVLCSYVLFFSHYAAAGSKLDQSAQFHCFI